MTRQTPAGSLERDPAHPPGGPAEAGELELTRPSLPPPLLTTIIRQYQTNHPQPQIAQPPDMLSSPPQPLFLALDGGGTKTRAVISTKTADGGAKVVAQAISGGSNVSEVRRTAVDLNRNDMADFLILLRSLGAGWDGRVRARVSPSSRAHKLTRCPASWYRHRSCSCR